MKELSLRKKQRSVRHDLAAWCRHIGFEPAPHHLLIISEINKLLESTEYDTLLIGAPPGSAKSSYVSIAFPSWYISRFPQNSILHASHTTTLAEKWGRRIRNTVEQHSDVLGVTLSPDNKAAARWSVTAGGEYYAVGVGVGISGFRADAGIIDDPYGSREDADSETIRDKIEDWFMADFSARLKPGAKRVVMATRWREDDLTGWIIEQSKKGKYNIRVLMLPAIAGADDPLGRKAGEYLWDEPGGYNYGSFLRARQKEMQPRDWSALYQQAPAPDEGLYFKREWFRFYDELPKNLRFYGASDYAVTADGGDYTVHGVAGIDADDNIYIAELWRHQTESNVWVDAFCDLVLKWRPLYWAEEQGQILKSLGPFIAKRILEKRSYCAREQFTSVSDKPTRARSFQARTAMGKVYLPSNATWLPAFLAECLSFPAGVNDDQVDMLGLLGRLLDKMVGLRIPQPAEPDPMSDYQSSDRTNAGDSWKWG